MFFDMMHLPMAFSSFDFTDNPCIMHLFSCCTELARICMKGGRSMAEEIKAGCARPTGGPVGEKKDAPQPAEEPIKKEASAMIKVGQKAPRQPLPAGVRGR